LQDDTILNLILNLLHFAGKRVFKQHLDLFTPYLLSTLTSPMATQLSQAAAVECMQSLGKLIGPNIFLGRIPQEDRSLYLSSCARFAGSSSSRAKGSGVESSAFPELRQLPSMVSI